MFVPPPRSEPLTQQQQLTDRAAPFQAAHLHSDKGEFDASLSAAALCIDYFGRAEALKRCVGDDAAADMLQEKLNDVLDFKESIAVRRTVTSMSALFGDQPSAAPNGSSPEPPNDAPGPVLGPAPGPAKAPPADCDLAETKGNALVVEALALDEAGDRVGALPLYVAAVEQYLRFLERENDAASVARVSHEGLSCDCYCCCCCCCCCGCGGGARVSQHPWSAGGGRGVGPHRGPPLRHRSRRCDDRAARAAGSSCGCAVA